MFGMLKNFLKMGGLALVLGVVFSPGEAEARRTWSGVRHHSEYISTLNSQGWRHCHTSNYSYNQNRVLIRRRVYVRVCRSSGWWWWCQYEWQWQSYWTWAYPVGTQLSNCNRRGEREEMVLACRRRGSNRLVVAAHAAYSAVTYYTGSHQSRYRYSNGTRWYYSSSYSWGFSRYSIWRTSCDTGGSWSWRMGSSYWAKMCWHTTGGYLSYGWSCGEYYGLNYGSGYERIMLTSRPEPARFTWGPHAYLDQHSMRIRIRAGFTPSHSGYVYVYRGGYASGGYCHSYSQYKGNFYFGRTGWLDYWVGGRHWNSDAQYGQRYCVRFYSYNGLRWSTMVDWPRPSRIRSKSNVVTQRYRRIAVTVDWDYATSGRMYFYRGGRVYSNGGWGTYCGNTVSPPRPGMWHWDSYIYNYWGSNVTRWSVTHSNLYHGYHYCVRVDPDRYRYGYYDRYIAWLTPRIDYARITSIRLTPESTYGATMRATAYMDQPTGGTFYLRRGGRRVQSGSNSYCTGGSHVWSWGRGSSTYHSVVFYNYAHAQHMWRSGRYCVQFNTNDGGGRYSAAEGVVPQTIRSITGSIDQNNARFPVSANWYGQAAGNAYISFYRHSSCGGSLLKVVRVPWNQVSGYSYTFDQNNTGGILRGYEYCARINLGYGSRIVRLGRLVAPVVTSLTAAVDQRSARLRVRAAFNHPAAPQVYVYRGGRSDGRYCNFVNGLHARGNFGTRTSLDYTWTVTRGYHYCVYVYLVPGGSTRSVLSERVIRMPVIQQFRGTSNHAGRSVHVDGQYSDVSHAYAEVWRGRASGTGCTGTRLMNSRTNSSYSDKFLHQAPQNTDLCARVVAYNGPLSVARAANLSTLATSRNSAGYTGTFSSSAAWDDILPLNPSSIRRQDDYTASVGLPFDFMYFGQLFSRVAISTNGWLSLGSARIDSDPNPANFGGAGDPPNLIAPFFANLYCDGVYWKNLSGAPERMVITWDCRERLANGRPVQFQAVLLRGLNRIEFRYRNAEFARFKGGGNVKQGLAYGNTYLAFNQPGLIGAAGGQGTVAKIRNPAYEEQLPRLTGVAAVLDQQAAAVQISGNSDVPASMVARLYRGGSGNTCAGGAYMRQQGPGVGGNQVRGTRLSETFTNLPRGNAFCLTVAATNTAGTAIKGVVTPELQLIPRILAYSAAINLENASVRTEWEAENLPGNAMCGVYGGMAAYQCDVGASRIATFTVSERGSVVLETRAGAQQAGLDRALLRFYVDGAPVGENITVTGERAFQWYRHELILDAGEHTVGVQFENDWCGACGGGQPDEFGRGDRNLMVDKLAVSGPHPIANSTGTMTWSARPNTDVRMVTTVTTDVNQAQGFASDQVGGPGNFAVDNNGTGDRVINHDQLTAGRDYWVKIAAYNDAGSADTGWLKRRFPAISNTRLVEIRKPSNEAEVAFSTAPGANGKVQYKAAGRYRFAGCDAGGNWTALDTSNSVITEHSVKLENLVDGTWYCWRAVAEYPRGAPWRTTVVGAPQHFVFDKTAPVISPPAFKVFEQENLSGATISLAALGRPTVSDRVDLVSHVGTPQLWRNGQWIGFGASQVLQLGSHRVRWLATDTSGNTGVSGNQRIDVRDTTAAAFAAGDMLIFEAASVQGTVVDLKTATRDAPSSTTYTANDLCDADLTLTQEVQVEGQWTNAATYRFPRSTNPDGSGDHTVRVRMLDDSGNTSTGTYQLRVIDTTAPVFTRVPLAIVGMHDNGCVSARIPRPRIQDNSYDSRDLSLTASHQDGPENTGGMCWNEGGTVENGIRVHIVTWTACDPQNNCRDATQRVEVRRPTLHVDHTVTSGGQEVEMGTYVRQPVSVQVTLTDRSAGCNSDPLSDPDLFHWVPEPTRVVVGGNGSFTGIYESDLDVIGGIVQVWHCDEFALLSNLTFGLDQVNPEHDFDRLSLEGVDADNVDTFPRLFVGNTLDLGGTVFTDDRSGVHTVAVTLNPGDPGAPWGNNTLLMEHRIDGEGIIISGPGQWTGLTCSPTASMCVTNEGRPTLDLKLLREADDGQALQHKLRYEVRDFAGNLTTTDFHFLLRDYRSTLVDVASRMEAMLPDVEGLSCEDDVRSAKDHLDTALGYWDARTAEGLGVAFRNRQIPWGPSFRRAQRAAENLYSARRNRCARVVSVFENDIGSSMLGEQRMYIDVMQDKLDNSDDAMGFWTTKMANSRANLASGYEQSFGRRKAAHAADSYDDLAALYELHWIPTYRIQERQKLADDSEDPREDRTLNTLLYALNTGIHDILKQEIKTAKGVSQAGRGQLQAVVDRLDSVAGCMDDLVRNNLNDRTFTLCYLDVIEIVRYLREAQGATVDTYLWRVFIGHAVYGMLDISIYHSLNALVTMDGHEEDAEALQGIAEYQAGMAELRTGQVDAAIDRYVANRCRMVQLYNRYWYDENDPGLALIEEGPYCD
jgi:hypothetical protein